MFGPEIETPFNQNPCNSGFRECDPRQNFIPCNIYHLSKAHFKETLKNWITKTLNTKDLEKGDREDQEASQTQSQISRKGSPKGNS